LSLHLFAPLIDSFLQSISQQHIPEGIYKKFGTWVGLSRAKGHLLCYRKVSSNILISIELLYHVLNDIPLLFTITSSLEG
jgi:hypothetical protein